LNTPGSEWQGYALSIGASILFGLIPWYLQLLLPLNGFTVDMAAGYFLLPLTMALTGMLVFGEQLRALQWLALQRM